MRQKKKISKLADFYFPPYHGIFGIFGLCATRFISLKSKIAQLSYFLEISILEWLSVDL